MLRPLLGDSAGSCLWCRSPLLVSLTVKCLILDLCFSLWRMWILTDGIIFRTNHRFLFHRTSCLRLQSGQCLRTSCLYCLRGLSCFSTRAFHNTPVYFLKDCSVSGDSFSEVGLEWPPLPSEHIYICNKMPVRVLNDLNVMVSYRLRHFF